MAQNFLPAKQNFPIWKGATFRYGFQWLDDNGKEKKPHDLTGYTAEALLLANNGEELLLSTGNGGIILGDIKLKEPSNGLIELFIKKSVTSSLEWKHAAYTLYATEPNPPNDTFPLLAGQFRVAGPPL